MDSVRLMLGDCLESLKQLEDNSVDSIVTDPPYGMSAAKNSGKTSKGGFMGKVWDYDVPPQEVWEECLRVLKPGGYLLSFSSSRTYHRMAVRVEDAGFEIRDQIMWVYGSGFPKSHNIGKAVDKIQGNEREVVGQKKHARKGVAAAEERTTVGAGAYGEARVADVTKGTSDWEGWGTALKPSHEPIVVARKPFKGTIANNVLKYGTGAINIDGCRVTSGDNPMSWSSPRGGIWKTDENATADYQENTAGRFPANLIHDGSDEVKALFPQSKGGAYPSKRGTSHIGFASGQETEGGARSMGDDGSAARYFYEVKPIDGDYDLLKYCPKANKKDREDGNNHPTVKPTDLMAYLCRLVTQPGGVVLDPYMGSGSTGKAAVREGFNFIGCELSEEYMEIAKRRIEHAGDVVEVSNETPANDIKQLTKQPTLEDFF